MFALFSAFHCEANEGYELLGMGPVQQGQAGAGAASPQDATWITLNPAGIVDLERRFDVSYETLLARRTLRPWGPIGIPFANKFAGTMRDDTPVFIPQIGVIAPGKNGTFGFGLFGMSGTGIDYENSRTTLGALLDHGDRRAAYYIAKIPVAYAHEFDNGWAVGVALHGNWTRLRTDSLTLRFTPAEADNDWDDALGIGLQLGVYKRWEKWGFGAAYSTRQWMFDFNQYADALRYNLDLPRMFVAGLAYEATPRLEFLLDYKFVDYDGIPQLGKLPITGGLGWDDQHVVKFGANWKAGGRWTLRAGFSYGESPLDNDVVFANALFPATTRYHGAFGATYRINKRHDLHFSFLHAFEREMTDNGRGDLFSIVGQGTKISIEADSFTVGYTYKF